MKPLNPLFLLLITFLKAYSQEASVKQTYVEPASKQVQHSQNLNHQQALPFMQKPNDLLNYWGDQTLPIAQYSEKEKAFQQHLNHVLSADFVLSYSPESVMFEGDNYKLPLNERNIDNEPITPYTWKWVRFELIHEDGSKDEVKLCRPNWWLNNLGANKVGEKVYLDIPETGINGTALVTKILPCQLDSRLLHEKREGEYVYRPITATFKHQSAEVWDFTFTGDETVGATNNHPFYSLDRQDYIPVGELTIGERVKNFAGTEIKLLSKAKRPSPEPVYNLEVYRDHNYLVGKGRILVHNACTISDKFNKFVDEFKDDVNYKKLFDSDNVVINYISDSELADFIATKARNGIASAKNIARGEYSVSIGGRTKSGNDWAIAGYTDGNKLPNLTNPVGLPPPSDATSIFKGSTFVYSDLPRGNDSEVKILDKIARELGATSITQRFPGATGKVKIITELFPCPSCTKIISVFKEMFPNIELEIVAQAKNTFKK
jgi:hypothetical protein